MRINCDPPKGVFKIFIPVGGGNSKPTPHPVKLVEVNQYSFEGKWMRTFASLVDASEKLGIARSSLSNCARGNYKTAGGFIWRYDKADTADASGVPFKLVRVVKQFTKDGKLVGTFSSVRQASDSGEFLVGGISKCALGVLRTYKNFVWTYENKTRRD